MADHKRVPWFDNAKGVLIFCVVMGHLIESYRHQTGNTADLGLYNAFYTFEMPLFILISGYFFREERFKKVVQFMGIFLIWQVIDGFLTPIIMTHHLPDFSKGSRIYKLLMPYWTLWYMMAMIVWRMVTPYLLRLRFPILISIGFAIWAATVPDLTGWFSLRKLIEFYPLYLIGVSLNKSGLLLSLREKVQKRPGFYRGMAGASVAAFIALLSIYTALGYKDNTQQIFARYNYEHFHWMVLEGALLSILFYIGVTVLCVSIMLLLPMNKNMFFFNTVGYYSLYVYMMHALLVRLFRSLAPAWITSHPAILIPTALAIAFIICWFATRFAIVKFFRPIVEPAVDSVFSSEDPAVRYKRLKNTWLTPSLWR